MNLKELISKVLEKLKITPNDEQQKDLDAILKSFTDEHGNELSEEKMETFVQQLVAKLAPEKDEKDDKGDETNKNLSATEQILQESVAENKKLIERIDALEKTNADQATSASTEKIEKAVGSWITAGKYSVADAEKIKADLMKIVEVSPTAIDIHISSLSKVPDNSVVAAENIKASENKSGNEANETRPLDGFSSEIAKKVDAELASANI